MVRSRRVSSSFAQWTSSGDAATLSATRRAIVTQLETAIQQHEFDSEKLQDIILILEHECLCWKYKNDRELPAGQDPGAFRATLETPRTDQLVVNLSSCLLRSIGPSSHYQRELQSKALLSALALLHAQRVGALQADFHDDLRARLTARFRDLQGVPGQRLVFSAETVRKIQCGYYLCLGAEYAERFRRAEPIVMTAASSVVSLLIVGASITSAAMATGPPNVESILSGLERALRPLWRSSNELFPALCTLQELTRITIALHAYGEAVADIDEIAYAKRLATVILEKILSIFNSDPGFQNDAGPRSVYLDYFVAFFNRGPSGLSRYFYQYGLLDCVSQLSGVISTANFSADLSNTLFKIIATCQEASYRWKCMEILMRDPDTRDTQLREVLDTLAQYNPRMAGEAESRFRDEVKVICELLDEEDGIPLTPATSIASPQDATVEAELSPSTWIESAQPSSTIRAHAQKSSISLPQGRRLARKRYHRAGLSPNGSHAYFAAVGDLYLYRLSTNDIVLHLNTIRSEYREAVLSNSFLAILKAGRTDSLEVYKYGSYAQTYSLKATQAFEPTSNEARWRTDCLAIHEARDRVYVAIAGRSNQHGTISGSIKMYRINIDGSNFRKHDVDFQRSRLNPFASDYVKSIAFAPNGRRLVCVTNNNRILVWLLWEDARPIQSPFQIPKLYTPEMRARGVTSATLFETALSNPYVLCTTSPSRERARNNGEWSYVSAVGDGPVRVPPQLDHDLWRLEKAKAIIAGAVSPDGTVIALLEETGKILLMPLVAEDGGGLSSLDPITVDTRLHAQSSASPTALRFCQLDGHLCLVAVDPQGTVLRLTFQDTRPAFQDTRPIGDYSLLVAAQLQNAV
ncbi:hypothetical protein MMC11_001482 [Xylographa trunciseda]|nr:hypothetical protein [Xylographa trunciseda]